MKQWSLIFVVATVLSALFVLPVHAQLGQPCNPTIVDGAGIFGAGLDRVQAAVSRLENAAADVRVRTFKTFGSYGNLDHYKDAALRNCRSWQSADRGMKNNLVIFLVAVSDRQVGLFFGDQWRPELDEEWPRIHSKIVTPRFKDGDFAGGIANGLDEVRRIIQPQVSRPVPQPAPAPAQPVQPVVPREPIDLSGLWQFLRLALIAGAALGFLYVLWRVLRDRAKEAAERRAAQQEALQAKNSCEKMINEIKNDPSRTVLEGRIKGLSEMFPEQDVAPLQLALQKLQEKYEGAAIEFGDYKHERFNPEHGGLSAGEYGSMATVYNKIADDLRDVKTATTSLDRDVKVLENVISSAPVIVKSAADSVEAASHQIDTVTAQGFRTESAQSVLLQATNTLKATEAALSRKALRQAIELGNKAIEQAKTASQAANLLPQKKEEVEQGVIKVMVRLPEVVAKIHTGRQVFEEISAVYAASSWRTIRGNGTEAENRLAHAEELIKEAQEQASMDNQRWQAALDAIAQANNLLDEGESLMRSIAALKQHLEAAKRDSQAEIEAATKDIEAARSYIAKYDADIRESLETDLAAAVRDLAEARRELNEQKPNYIEVVKSAQSANQAADKILAQARSEHEAAERLRQRAIGALRDAKRAVSAAEEYIEDHRVDVERHAESLLETARVLLGRVESVGDLKDKVEFAEQAEAKADEALKSAEADVEKEEGRRRESTAYVGWGGSPYSRSSSRGSSHDEPASSHRSSHDEPSPSYGGSSGGGGSSPFGISGGGGGGSTGWGGSSRGGGGSSGW